MTDHPILFSGPMVRALLDGRKTQTRRVLNERTTWFDGHPWSRNWATADELDWVNAWVDQGPSPAGNPGPYLKVPLPREESVHRLHPRIWPGDRLWVREKWWAVEVEGCGIGAQFLVYDDEWSSGPGARFPKPNALRPISGYRWGAHPSIHMPRSASRLTLLVTDVKVERLQDISEEDAKAEGIRLMRHGGGTFVGREGPGPLVTPWPTATEAFADIWDSLNAKRGYGWDVNPWVVAITFEVKRHNIDMPAAEAA